MKNYNSNMIVSFIAARGNSKRIPRKNMRLWHGIPLVSVTLAASFMSKKVALTVLSSEDDEILQEGKKVARSMSQIGNFITIKRPPYWSEDTVQTQEVSNHSLRTLARTTLDVTGDGIAVILQPPSPLRTAKHIDEAISTFVSAAAENPRVSTLTSGYRMMMPSHFIWKEEYGVISPLGHNPLARAGTQTMPSPQVFVENGAIYVTTLRNMATYGTYRAGVTVPYYMEREDSVDIDNEEDFVLTEKGIAIADKIRENGYDENCLQRTRERTQGLERKI